MQQATLRDIAELILNVMDETEVDDVNFVEQILKELAYRSVAQPHVGNALHTAGCEEWFRREKEAEEAQKLAVMKRFSTGGSSEAQCHGLKLVGDD